MAAQNVNSPNILTTPHFVFMDNSLGAIRKCSCSPECERGVGTAVYLVCSGCSSGGLAVAHQRLVVRGWRPSAVVQLPAQTTVVAETAKVTTEVDAGLTNAHITRRLLQVRINLNLWPTLTTTSTQTNRQADRHTDTKRDTKRYRYRSVWIYDRCLECVAACQRIIFGPWWTNWNAKNVWSELCLQNTVFSL